MEDSPQDPVSLGPYRVLRKLGEGGMGTVFLALSPGYRLVALKMIRSEYDRDPGFRGRFRQEVTAAQKVSGLFTPPVLDADPDGTPPWLATSYVPAPSLHEVVRSYGVMDGPALNALGAGLAEALIAVHKQGITHLDLKPGNVLIASDGPRVIDFGIAGAFGADASPSPGGLIGTPGYMAPEQIAFGRETGPATDIFALGCVLTFAGTGAHPFGSGESGEILDRTKNAEPALDGMPAGIRSLVSDCLDKDPGRRPEVETVLESLRPADPGALISPILREELTRRGLEAEALRRQPPPAPSNGASRRRFFAVSAAAGAVLGLAAAGGTRLLQNQSRSMPGSRPSQPGSAAAAVAGPAPVPLWRSALPQSIDTTSGPPTLSQVGATLVRWNENSALGFNVRTGSAAWAIPSGSVTGTMGFLGVLDGTLVGFPRLASPTLLGIGPAGKTTFAVPGAPVFSEVIPGLAEAAYVSLGAADGVAVILVTAMTGAQASAVVAVDLVQRRRLWHRPVPWGSSAYSYQSTGFRIPGGAVDTQHCYLQDGTSTLALDLRTGAVKWSARNTSPDTGGIPPVMTAADGALFITSTGTVNLALDPANGAQLWSNANLGALATATGKGRLYVQDTQNGVQALNSRTGKIIWHTPNPVPDIKIDTGTTPALSVSSTLVAASLWTTDSGMVVLSATDGRPLWAYRDPVGTGSAWAVLASASTVYGASAAALYAFPARAS